MPRRSPEAAPGRRRPTNCAGWVIPRRNERPQQPPQRLHPRPAFLAEQPCERPRTAGPACSTASVPSCDDPCGVAVGADSSHSTDPREEENLSHVVWRLAWPAVVTMMLQFANGLVDMFFVGRLGPAAQAAVGMGGQVVMLLLSLSMAVTSGATAIVARYVGAGDRAAAAETAKQALLLAGLALAPGRAAALAAARRGPGGDGGGAGGDALPGRPTWRSRRWRSRRTFCCSRSSPSSKGWATCGHRWRSWWWSTGRTSWATGLLIRAGGRCPRWESRARRSPLRQPRVAGAVLAWVWLARTGSVARDAPAIGARARTGRRASCASGRPRRCSPRCAALGCGRLHPHPGAHARGHGRGRGALRRDPGRGARLHAGRGLRAGRHDARGPEPGREAAGPRRAQRLALHLAGDGDHPGDERPVLRAGPDHCRLVLS